MSLSSVMAERLVVPSANCTLWMSLVVTSITALSSGAGRTGERRSGRGVPNARE